MADTGNDAPENGPPAPESDAAPKKVWKGTNYPTAADFPDGKCVIGKGSELVANPADSRWEWVVGNCQLDKGVKLLLPDVEEEVASTKTKSKSKKAKAEKAEAKEEAVPAPEPELDVPAPAPVVVAPPPAAPAAPVAPAAPIALTTAPPAPVQTEAVVGVDQAIGQMKSLLPASAQNNPGLMVGGAAALAVIGAAIKFAPQVMKMLNTKSEKLHELEMKKLELEEKKQEKAEEGHGKCEAARMALAAQVNVAESKAAAAEGAAAAAEAKAREAQEKLEEMEAKLEKLSKKAAAFDMDDFDPEELEARLKKLEKALKPAKKKA